MTILFSVSPDPLAGPPDTSLLRVVVREPLLFGAVVKELLIVDILDSVI